MNKVTVIVPSYNHSKYICNAVESILNQTHKNVEILVIDDASSDDTIEKLAIFKDKIKIIINKTNIGLQQSILKASTFITGEFVAILSSDDEYQSSKLEKQLDLINDGGYDVVYSGLYFIDGHGNENLKYSFSEDLNSNPNFEEILKSDETGLLLQSALFKASTFIKTESLRIKFLSDDWAILCWLIVNSKVGFINLPLLGYRRHDSNSHQSFMKQVPSRLQVINEFTPKEFYREAIQNIIYSILIYRWESNKKLSFSLLIFYATIQLSLKSTYRSLKVIAFHIIGKNVVKKIINIKQNEN